ncbi:MAG: ABC transporter substrate-binding protein, partial [Deltaproteobacteria bacterium]
MKAIGKILALCALFFSLCFSVQAQQPKKIYRLGYLLTGSSSTSAATREAFLDGMSQLGYVENQNLLIEYRYANGQNERLPELAADIVRVKVDVILAGGTQATLAAKNATATIPIVSPSSSGLFDKGLAKTLAQPGGNITGFSTMGVELMGKQLEIFRESLPKARRLAVVWYKDGNVDFQQIRSAGKRFGFDPFSFEVARSEDFETAFALARRERVDSLFTPTAAFLASHRKRIIDFAANNKLPAMYFQELFVVDGGLMSYSANIEDLYR